MSAWGWVAATAVLLLAVGIVNGAEGSRQLLDERSNCASLHKACSRCQSVSAYVAGELQTKKVCRACNTQQGWGLVAQGNNNNNNTVCACLPGRYLNNGECTLCSRGMVCAGGSTPPRSCPEGLATVMSGARSMEQCMTTAGYGRSVQKTFTGQVVVRSQLCPIGSFNTGGNSSPCQRCSSGLTTVGQGAGSANECVAPAGFYKGTSSGIRCPRGTYTDAANNAPSCTPCSQGLTTPREASVSRTDCRLAKAGFYVQAAVGEQPPADAMAAASAAADAGASDANTTTEFVAIPCPLGTYQDKETEVSSCLPCPGGLTTQAEGADGVALCLAPPGAQLLPGAANISDCPRGSYKEGWNLNLCLSCGEGLETPGPGAVSPDSCYVPAGFGIEVDDASGSRKAVICTSNSYGQEKPSYDLLTTRCIPCPEGTATADIQSSIPASSGYTSSQACMPLPGWGYTTSGAVERCMVGSWSAGGQQRNCRPCPAMFTTEAEGATSSAECIVQPGWAVQAVRGLPQPCNKGTYSTGGSGANPGGTCVACPLGFTTQESMSGTTSDCSICAPGYGGPNCLPCGYGTFSFGGSTSACRSCDAGHTSARGAETSSQCVLVWPQEKDSYTTHVHANDESAWSDMPPGDASEQDCKVTCGAGCIMYHYTTSQRKCQVLMALTPGTDAFKSRAAVGFKAFSGGAVIDYAFYYIPASLSIGVQLQDVGRVTLGECIKACSRIDACVLVRVAGNGASGGSLDSCALFTGQLDPDWMTSYQVAPQNLLGDGLAVTTEGQ